MRLHRLFGRSSRRGSPGSTFGGFTMIEVVTVAVVMGTLVRVALPNFHELILKARAAEVVGDFETVRLAVLNYHAEHLEWPEDSYVGRIPEGLEEFLPDNYTFIRSGYRLDWENWVLPNGLPKHPETGVLLGISINTTDAELGNAIVEFLGGAMANYVLGDNYTFIIERM
jgi:hypothetical protein